MRPAVCVREREQRNSGDGMTTFSHSQRDQLSRLWSQKAKLDSNINKRIHEEEEQLIAEENEKRKRMAKKQREARDRKRKVGTVDHDANRDRSQELASKSRSRLSFSRFRSMNEFLYTHSTNQAVEFMDEQSFDLYHTAYSEIAVKWPIRPIDHICDRMRKLFKGKGKGKVFADMGCGSRPLIAEAFEKATVHSFDLVSKDERITPADVSKLPLPNAVCDCVVFSLSLMGSNIMDQLKEGSRILKEKGILMIAEVTSRFKSVNQKTKTNKTGEKSVKESGTDKRTAGDEEKEEEEAEEAEIDSVDSFVSKLSKLGFVLKQQENLEPNNFFVVLEFERKAGVTKKKKKLPSIQLKACQYKPR